MHCVLYHRGTIPHSTTIIAVFEVRLEFDSHAIAAPRVVERPKVIGVVFNAIGGDYAHDRVSLHFCFHSVRESK